MGGQIAPAPRDKLIETIIKRLEMSDENVEKLWRLFCNYDVDGAGYITKQAYFELIVGTKRSLLTEAMFEIVPTKEKESISFPEFFQLTTTFACFTTLLMIQFCFCIFDREKTGFVNKDEIKHFFYLIWDHEITSNLKKGVDYLEQHDDGDGQFTFDQIVKLNQLFPNVFYPVMKLQILIQQSSLGENYWEETKLLLTDKVHEQHAADALKSKKKKEESESVVFDNGISDDQLLKKIGYIKFYLLPWNRTKEKKKIAKLFAINDALEDEIAQFAGKPKKQADEIEEPQAKAEEPKKIEDKPAPEDHSELQ